jgi:hypothetical protein
MNSTHVDNVINCGENDSWLFEQDKLLTLNLGLMQLKYVETWQHTFCTIPDLQEIRMYISFNLNVLKEDIQLNRLVCTYEMYRSAVF